MNKENRTAYLGISKSKRIFFSKEIEALKACLKKYNTELNVFVDNYDFILGQEKEMMHIAFDEICQCDLLIAELSYKAIGVGIEVGYAKALNKKIIYLKKKEAKYSTTLGGTADHIIEYADEKDLLHNLDALMQNLS